MSEIQINCPKCWHLVYLETQELNQAQGRAVCPNCNHLFKLVKKPKQRLLEEEMDDVLEHEPISPEFLVRAPSITEKAKYSWQHFLRKSSAPINELASVSPELQSNEIDLNKDAKALFSHIYGNMGGESAELNDVVDEPESPPPLVKTVAAMSAMQRTQRPLSYREPKAWMPPRFAEVSDNPLTFNLMDRESVKAQLPQVSLQPAHNPANPTNAPASTTASSEMQKNNITIHTDSLVFTLVNDGGSNMLPSTQMNQLLSNQLNTRTATPAQLQNEINWVIATVAALVVLVMQLFYWILLMS